MMFSKDDRCIEFARYGAKPKTIGGIKLEDRAIGPFNFYAPWTDEYEKVGIKVQMPKAMPTTSTKLKRVVKKHES